MNWIIFVITCGLIAKALGGFALLPFVMIAFLMGFMIFAWYGRRKYG